MSREENLQACLPLDYTADEYNYNNKILLVGLILTLIFLGLEFICFLSGISMFMPIQGLISTVAHATASLTLSFFIIDQWNCTDFFYIFGFCSAFPALTEFIVIIGVCAFHRGI
ncbi:Transmembrane protein 107 [Lamellibrachia satsuma]|nr:Transmembrane protein 107 [Lamellibrachia satsuma]